MGAMPDAESLTHHLHANPHTHPNDHVAHLMPVPVPMPRQMVGPAGPSPAPTQSSTNAKSPQLAANIPNNFRPKHVWFLIGNECSESGT